jgi:16S rRNA (guanine966-N2)-methyltransferase
MRIIGGKFKGRRFHPPADKWPTRPTTDVSKEALFNILQNTFDFEDIKVLDLFCGTGNHTYEFVSRGCTEVTCVDQHGPCIAFVKKTIAELDITGQVTPVRADAFSFIAQCGQQYHYIFAGPPYGLATMDKLPDLIFEHRLLRPGGWFVLEHNPNHEYRSHPRFLQERKYGQTIFSIFEEEENVEP